MNPFERYLNLLLALHDAAMQGPLLPEYKKVNEEEMAKCLPWLTREQLEILSRIRKALGL